MTEGLPYQRKKNFPPCCANGRCQDCMEEFRQRITELQGLTPKEIGKIVGRSAVAVRHQQRLMA